MSRFIRDHRVWHRPRFLNLSMAQEIINIKDYTEDDTIRKDLCYWKVIFENRVENIVATEVEVITAIATILPAQPGEQLVIVSPTDKENDPDGNWTTTYLNIIGWAMDPRLDDHIEPITHEGLLEQLTVVYRGRKIAIVRPDGKLDVPFDGTYQSLEQLKEDLDREEEEKSK